MNFDINERHIAESLRSTLENVTREFIIETMKDILFSSDAPNFNFIFMEKEGIMKKTSNYILDELIFLR